MRRISALRVWNARCCDALRAWPDMCPCGVVEARIGGRPRLWWVRRGELSGIEGGGDGGVSILYGAGLTTNEFPRRLFLFLFLFFWMIGDLARSERYCSFVLSSYSCKARR